MNVPVARKAVRTASASVDASGTAAEGLARLAGVIAGGAL